MSPTLSHQHHCSLNSLIRWTDRSLNSRLLYHYRSEILEFVESPQYHKNEHLKTRCMKVAAGLKSSATVANVGVAAMTWINVLEPMWHAFKDPLPEKKAKEIVETLYKVFSNPSNEVFDDMIKIGSYLGGQSEKEISAEVVKVRFNSIKPSYLSISISQMIRVYLI